MGTISFAKGHGTRNDFVLLLDPTGERELSDEQVRYLCDRRAGVGADGILRVVRASAMPQLADSAAEWFMDYRNADGSIAEMCGNGLRVFLRYLAEQGLIEVSGPVPVATRAGLRTGRFQPDGRVAVTMGRVELGPQVEVGLAGRTWPATAVSVGNPHAVSVLGEGEVLAELDLQTAPTVAPGEVFPAGANFEFVARSGPGQLSMRVYERGVGETASCGTGVVAAAAAAGGREHCRVQVPGGELEVDLSGEEAVLIGPAVIVARGELEWPHDLG